MKINLLYCRKHKYAISFLAISLIMILGASPAIAQTACADDNTTADFTAGLKTNTYVSDMNGGEVILKPAAAAEFSVLPPAEEWNSFPWDNGGSSTVSGGLLTVDGARFNTEPEATAYGPGTSIEFIATFAATRFQHIGFGAGNDNTPGEMFNIKPWAMFSTGSDGTQLLARTSDGTNDDDFSLGNSFLGSSHLYKIEWITASEFKFYIDGSLVYTNVNHIPQITINQPMRVAISDLFPGGDVVTVDWIHVSPYASSGTFESRIFGGNKKTAWGTVSITSDIPEGTSLSTDIRTGNTPMPDASWTGYTTVANGDDIPVASKYIQYRANLTTNDPTITPVLKDFSLGGCSTCTLQAVISEQTNITCNGEKEGSITISATNGTPPYEYKLGAHATPQTGNTFSNLRAKDYKVFVTDKNGCTRSVAVVLTEPPAATLTITKSDVTCQGGHDGSITVNATGGSGSFKYKDRINGTPQSSGTFNHLIARTYRVFAIDNGTGCTSFVNVTITEPETPCQNIISGVDNSDDIYADSKLNSNDLNIKISPNPSVSEFSLMLNGNNKENIDIKVIDMFGKTVYKINGPANKLYRFGNELRSGVYILQVMQGSKSKTVKIIKQ